MTDEKSETPADSVVQPEVSAPPAEDGASLGQYLISVRTSRGLSHDQIIAGTHIPKRYVAAIESGDYATVSDELYLLPFLRRYAVFVGLDPEDIAYRFVRDVQRAESNAIPKISEPIAVVESGPAKKKSSRANYVIATVVIVLAVILVGEIYARRDDLRMGASDVASSPAASPIAPPVANSAAPAAAASQVSAVSNATPQAPEPAAQDSPAPASSPAAAAPLATSITSAPGAAVSSPAQSAPPSNAGDSNIE